MKPFERLNGPIFADGTRDPFNQFLAVGLHPLSFALCLLVDYHIH
ncbi:MAG: hypothetical protein PVSMB2_05970 [Ktedonobacteraceae bacterium]